MDAPLYLDHAATTPPLPEALEAFQRAVESGFANPGSLHQAGADAARMIEKARKSLRESFGARNYQVVWTATGTEGNHLGIQGLARAQRKVVERKGLQPRVLVGALEHPSALLAAQALAEEGFVVETLAGDGDGIIRPEVLEAALGEDVVMVTIQWANNEIGSLNPIQELVARTRRGAPNALFHSDAVQAVGKCSTALDRLGADSYSVAAHKLGGIRGCAAFLLREGCVKPKAQFVGGGHESGLRSGTENTMGIAAFAAAAKVRRQWMTEEPDFLASRRRNLVTMLKEIVPDLVTLGPEDESEQLGAVLSIAIPGIRAEPFLHRLESEGVLVGSGSACHAHGHTESAVLMAIQLPANLRNSVLRLSLCGDESRSDLQRTAKAIEGCLATS
ncbi:MAG: aminotransferase class V-fold PLP-dependent enzyme [Planctomycetota bacterium]|nr:aminotransferase class V-fold PLP-dependent enzyme [Planctomycetota bacterium]